MVGGEHLGVLTGRWAVRNGIALTRGRSAPASAAGRPATGMTRTTRLPQTGVHRPPSLLRAKLAQVAAREGVQQPPPTPPLGERPEGDQSPGRRRPSSTRWPPAAGPPPGRRNPIHDPDVPLQPDGQLYGAGGYRARAWPSRAAANAASETP
ncbi:hypothetical protein LV779_34765 [Streptomyces thinghirensis]|nr:hypothetical protein [Streptomyces thinghirensis]